MRTIVDLPEKDLLAVKALAKRENVSQAEAVRRAVKAYLASHQPGLSADAFGLWADGTDGVAYQRELRDEWPR